MRIRAIIVDGERILLIERKKQNRHYWVFPGGGVESSDITPEAALVRECREELGVVVRVGKLYDTYKGDEDELFYLCRIASGVIGKIGGPESTRDPAIWGQYKPVWLTIAEIADKNVLPEQIKSAILDRGGGIS